MSLPTPDVILLKTVFGGLAALGFGLLFNIPPKSRLAVFGTGAGALCVRTLAIPHTGDEIAWLLAALLAGLLATLIGGKLRMPTTIIAVPALIAMVPGAPLHRALFGLIALNHVQESARQAALLHIFENGLKAGMLTLALVVGFSVPNVVARSLRARRIGESE